MMAEKSLREMVAEDLFIHGQESTTFEIDDGDDMFSLTFIEHFDAGVGFFELQIFRSNRDDRPFVWGTGFSVWKKFGIRLNNPAHPKIRATKTYSAERYAIIRSITGHEILQWADYIERFWKLQSFS